jgi:hypothetical protein
MLTDNFPFLSEEDQDYILFRLVRNEAKSNKSEMRSDPRRMITSLDQNGTKMFETRFETF